MPARKPAWPPERPLHVLGKVGALGEFDGYFLRKRTVPIRDRTRPGAVDTEAKWVFTGFPRGGISGEQASWAFCPFHVLLRVASGAAREYDFAGGQRSRQRGCSGGERGRQGGEQCDCGHLHGDDER